jgi:hypothetical protein
VDEVGIREERKRKAEGQGFGKEGEGEGGNRKFGGLRGKGKGKHNRQLPEGLERGGRGGGGRKDLIATPVFYFVIIMNY